VARRVHHPRSGASVLVPEGWETSVNAGSDALVTMEPATSLAPFRTNMVLTVVDNGGLSFRDWQVATDEMLPRMLADYLLLDLEKMTVWGHPGGRRLAHHISPDGVAVTSEQWFTAVGSRGYTLTATTETSRYDEMADDLANLALGVQIPAADRA
jgi:hypothetical protein